MADHVTLRLPSGETFTIDAEDAERVQAFRWRRWSRKNLPGKLYVWRTWREVVDGKLRQRSEFLHRFLTGVTDPAVLVDHRNGSGLDNRRQNLRLTDHRGNATNVVHSKRQKLGGYKGVSWNPTAQKWQASICGGEIKPNGKRRQLYLGVFVDPVAAARVYDEAALKCFGEFAALNFPLEPVAGEPANTAAKESA